MQSVRAEPEYSLCRETMDGEASPEELVLIVACTQSQSPTEYHSPMVPHPGEQAHLEEGISREPNKEEPQSDQINLSETKCDSDNSSSQTRMFLQGSAVIFSEEAPYLKSSREQVIQAPLSPPLHLTFDTSQVSSHAISETLDDHKAREGAALSPWSSEPNPTQQCSPSVQSVDCLPTFTSQRPPDLPSTMGKWALSNTWNVSNTTPYEYRYVFSIVITSV